MEEADAPRRRQSVYEGGAETAMERRAPEAQREG